MVRQRLRHRAALGGVRTVAGARRGALGHFRASRQIGQGIGALIAQLTHPGQHPFELLGPAQRRLIFGAERIEPRQVRQQQPRIEPPPHRNQLAAVIDRLLHPFQSPLGQGRLGMIPRQVQGRSPGRREAGIPPPRQIGPRPRNPHPPGGDPDIAVIGQLVEEPQLERRGEDGVGGRRG